MPADAPTEVDVTLLLCDAAQSVGGKLYTLGAGWTQVNVAAPGAGIPMALAVRVRIPWDRANETFEVEAGLVDADGEQVEISGLPIRADGRVEVGRPPGLERGTPLDTMLALTFPGLPLHPGTYVWQLKINGDIRARERFRVVH